MSRMMKAVPVNGTSRAKAQTSPRSQRRSLAGPGDEFFRDRGHRVDAAAFFEVRLLAALNRRQAAELVHVSVRTLRNWEQGKAGAPYSAFELLRILGCYELPGAAWRGWTIRGDMLWSPEGRSFEAVRLEYWGLTCAIARQWHHEQAHAAGATS